MGRLKEMATEYNCDIEYASESQLLNVFVRGIIDHTSAKENQEMQEFYEQVLPYSNGESRYWLFVQDETKTITNLHFKSKKEYIETIIKLSEFETFNVFYSLANYKDGHNNKNVISLKCAAVDIDDIDFDVSTKSKEELVDYIKREYALSDDELPNYLIMSGHGLHLYYPPLDVTDFVFCPTFSFFLVVIISFKKTFAAVTDVFAVTVKMLI